MLRIEHHHTTHRTVIIAAITGVLLVTGAVALVFSWRANAPKTVSRQPAPAVVTTTGIETKLLVMGDVYWGRYINDWSMASPLGYAYPFQKLNEFGRDDYDAWIADMECPITDNPKVSSAVEDSTLQFDCSPAYLPEAKKWFTAFTLANNHTDNQGAAGYAETQQHLAESGIQYFGSYDPEDHDNLCDVLSIPTHITMSDGTAKQGMFPMVWCGYHGVFKTPSAESIAVLSDYASLFTVIAMPHSGAEYKAEPDEIKTTLYRQLIDAGADVVIGDHPHWVQTTEAYKGRLILYSLGNFIFDQQFNSDVTRSALLSITATVTALDAPDIDAWLALGEQCKTYKDTCLQTALEQQLQKVPLQLHFSILGSNDMGKITHRANDEQLASLKQRLRWDQTITGLSGRNSGE